MNPDIIDHKTIHTDRNNGLTKIYLRAEVLELRGKNSVHIPVPNDEQLIAKEWIL